ncbi:adenosylcobinamide-GDP ribazoletransferase [Picosynechococcus sp. PCC 11901]|uniref:adenosylcobinamide-GDP ribazoletransferase n=1 Tax=Picosynechococcus sp. PCC 11901 TaxID=2579791 RepID=UPI0010FC2E29|nr:adenosylcobinamide-GDP ribazoletransferase [Picosynechococcus sp. PCC 11901]QCS48590.1 adenosylcobinamide-GDP ribazoletransferase [Picosynechococcus sp. PCC 11901]
MVRFLSGLLQLWRSLLGAILFYTLLPLPKGVQPSFIRIARWCPWVGLIIGGILLGSFWGLESLKVPALLRSAILVAFWLGLTGGLHLDGAMDAADGLAVTEPKRRLAVMADSVSGAFGVMTGILILLLKVAALEGLGLESWYFFVLIPAWGRWSQVVAIAFYPYLKAEGKGAFHKQQFQLYPDLCWSICPMLLFVFLSYFFLPISQWLSVILSNLWFMAVAIAVSTWFGHKFQGHTGDTYGATVEWTEVACLVSIVLLANRL